MFNLKESLGSKHIVKLKHYKKTKYVDNKTIGKKRNRFQQHSNYFLQNSIKKFSNVSCKKQTDH